jgi:hypothetical protein
MIRFGDNTDCVEIGLATQEDADLPSKGDVYLTIAVRSSGYCGQNDLWVDNLAFCSFCSALDALEQRRSGEALLESISPDELRLRIYSIDSCGHMAIEGITGYALQKEHRMFRHSVQFGFEFDPSQLLDALKEDWIRRNRCEPGGLANYHSPSAQVAASR